MTGNNRLIVVWACVLILLVGSPAISLADNVTRSLPFYLGNFSHAQTISKDIGSYCYTSSTYKIILDKGKVGNLKEQKNDCPAMPDIGLLALIDDRYSGENGVIRVYVDAGQQNEFVEMYTSEDRVKRLNAPESRSIYATRSLATANPMKLQGDPAVYCFDKKGLEAYISTKNVSIWGFPDYLTELSRLSGEGKTNADGCIVLKEGLPLKLDWSFGLTEAMIPVPSSMGLSSRKRIKAVKVNVHAGGKVFEMYTLPHAVNVLPQ